MSARRVLQLPDESATEQLGALLAECLRQSERGVLLFLRGDLGMGKTTLSRGLIQALGHQGSVKSPTYTLVEPYEDLIPPVYHFDLYRLGDPEELEFMGIRDYLDQQTICLVEWPDRGDGLLPSADLNLDLTERDQGRRLALNAGTARGDELLESLFDRLQGHWLETGESDGQ